MRMLLGLVLFFAVGCVQSAAVPCGETLCPTAAVCVDPATGQCAAPLDVQACEGKAEGAACEGALGTGACNNGVCTTASCGNAIVDASEACDDGNRASGDGCRSDCGKVEACGDALLDAGEACDDGNQNAVDGCNACQRVTWAPRALVGAPRLALMQGLDNPNTIAVDVLGQAYLLENATNRILKIGLDGSLVSIAGTGAAGYSGDGGPATAAALLFPLALAVDGLGNIYVADGVRIRKIDRHGIIRTIAGTGELGTDGDGGPASAARFLRPEDLALDGLGNLYIADSDAHRIRKIDTAGIITTVAGSGTEGFGGDGGLATMAELRDPRAIALDAVGTLYIGDSGNFRVRKVTDGIITSVAGNGEQVFAGDEGPATDASLEFPVSIATDATGVVYIASGDRVRRFAPNGNITTLVGTGQNGFGGDNGPARDAQLNQPESLATDTMGRVWIADSGNNRIRRVSSTGTIETIAGNGAPNLAEVDRPAINAQIGAASSLAIDAGNNLVLTDQTSQFVRKISHSGLLSNLAGVGAKGFSGDGGPATAAHLFNPSGAAFDAAGNLYIADQFNSRVRRVDANGVITTFAGTGNSATTGDGGPATDADIAQPVAVAVDATGNVYIADSSANRVRKVAPNGTITTFAGNGTFGALGDNGPAVEAELATPSGLGVNAAGEVFIVDRSNARIRKVTTNGVIVTVAGNGSSGFGGDDGPATAAQLDDPSAIALDSTGNLFIADRLNVRVRRVSTAGVITTIAGTGSNGFVGDGGPATAAQLESPVSLAVASDGSLYIGEEFSGRIRKVSPNGIMTTVLGMIGPSGIGPATRTRLDNPLALTGPAAGMFIATGPLGNVVRFRAEASGNLVERVVGRYPHAVATANLAGFRANDFGTVDGIAWDASTGTLFVAETSAHRIHAVATTGPGIDPSVPETWTIAPLVNAAGTAGYLDGPAATARLREPTGLLLDEATRTLYIAERGNHTVRALELATQQLTTVINTSNRLGFAGDAGPASAALLYQPDALARCPNGDFFVADTGNHRIRRIAGSTVATPAASETAAALVTASQLAAATISTVLGDGVAASSGEGAPANNFPVDNPLGISCDLAGNVFVSSRRTLRALPANAQGIVDGTGPVRTIFGDATSRLTFPANEASCLTAVRLAAPTDPALVTTRATAHATTLTLADSCSGLLIELQRQ